MTIDERGRRAADRLRHSVEVDLDTEGALRDVHAGGSRRSGSWRRVAVVSAAAVVLFGMFVGLATLTDRSEDATPVPTTTVPETTVPVPVTTLPDDATPEQLLEVMPAGPLDGKDSMRLPVLVTPQAGVADGSTITALGRGYVPGERVGIVMCASESAVEGVAACDLGTRVPGPVYDEEGMVTDSTSISQSFDHVTYADATEAGTVRSEVVLRQMIDTPFTGPIDCASAAERCLIAIGAVSDYDRSGGSFVNFATAPPFPEPVLTIDVPGPYAEGQAVTVTASGLLSPREVRLQLCREMNCATFASGRVATDGTFAGPLSLTSAFLSDDDVEVFCDGRCSIHLTAIGLPDVTSAPIPVPLLVTFADETPPAPPITAPASTGWSEYAPPSVPATAVAETQVIIVGTPYVVPSTTG